MSAPRPWVSIVVPSWQQGKYVRAALSSLLRQTYPYLEILVRDNLSTDETPAVLDEYAPRLAGVTRERDEGQADALRKGFASSKGEVFGWLNSDDLLYPETVAQAVAALSEHPDAGVVHGHAVWMDENGQFLRYFHETQAVTADLLFNCGPFISQPSTFFRRDVYERVGGLDASLQYGMDWDLWCRMAKAGTRFQLTKHLWSAMRIHSAAKTSGGGHRRLRELHGINRRHKTTLLPVATLGLAYGEYVRRRMPWLDGPLRGVWSRLSGQKEFLKNEIEGLVHPNRLARSSASVRVPRYALLGSASLQVDPGGLAEDDIRARLNSRDPDSVRFTPSCWEARWTLDPPIQADVVEADIETTGWTPERCVRVLSLTVNDAADGASSRRVLLPAPRGSGRSPFS